MMPACGSAANPDPCRQRTRTGVVPGPRAGRLQATAENGHANSSGRIKVAEESTGERGPVQIDSKVCYSATVPTLVGLSKEAEMIVVGYRGHGGVLVRNFLGSVSSGLVYHAHCPVAVIHDEEPLVANAARAPVLLCIDGRQRRKQRLRLHSTKRHDDVSVWWPCTPGLIRGLPTSKSCSRTIFPTLCYPTRRRRLLNGWRVGTNAIPTWGSFAKSKLVMRQVR